MKKREYNHKDIEKKWQDAWREQGVYRVEDSVTGKENFYTLVEFAYPSGNLHVGHWYAFAIPDMYARYKRMKGFNVLYPMGFDAFGLPAENAAIKLGQDPKVWTYSHMDKMREQFYSIGTSFDWSREVVTCDPSYYKWTQWMFAKFLKKDLVYRATTQVNWCPKDKTVLANEQVTNGCCERCGAEVIQKDQDQWMFRITKYADRLIDDLDTLDWPEHIKEAQKNWIGRSEGSEIEFKITTSPQPSPSQERESIRVFTTRADTLFGVTYVVLSPEHTLVSKLKESISNWNEVEKYISLSKKKSDLDRQQSKEKTGVELQGIKAINPANGEEVPVWVADYVLVNYGTGAVMAVPAHDERDFEFAKKYNLPIKKVIARETGQKRENEEFRNGGAGIIFDPATQKYAVSEFENGKILLFAGGVDDGESVEKGVLREVAEESGLYDFKYVEWIESSYAHYFNTLKQVNRSARAECFLIILNSAQTKPTKLEAHEKFTLGWKTAEEIKTYWETHNDEDGLKHYIRFLDESVARAIELGYDTTSDAKKFKTTCLTDCGILEDSATFTGLPSEEAKKKITEHVGGKMVNTYRLRDWGISRQRYWGVPIPIVYDPAGKAHAVPNEHLPWLLPTDVDHTPDGTAPLARSAELKKRVTDIFGEGWTPEVETMDTFVDSSWYFYRYLDPKNENEFASKASRKAWMPINMYFGGAEHTTMHLLYSRFWVKAMHDAGMVEETEPYLARRNRGLILGPDGNKMSKSKGNVIDPDQVVQLLGADTVRLYLAFMGPYGDGGNYPWDPNGVVGVRKFLERVWRLVEKNNDAGKTTSDTASKALHKAIKKISEDIAEYKFNTCISQMMILLNLWEKEEGIAKQDLLTFCKLLSPFAPHIAEELWHELGETASIHLSTWPQYDESKIVDDEVTIALQVNGKVRAELIIPVDMDEEIIKSKAQENEMIKKWTDGKKIVKIVYVKGRLVNIVAV